MFKKFLPAARRAEEQSSEIQEGFICPICATTLPSPEQLQTHFKQHEEHDVLQQPAESLDTLRQEIVDLRARVKEGDWYVQELQKELDSVKKEAQNGVESRGRSDSQKYIENPTTQEEVEIMKQQTQTLDESNAILVAEVERQKAEMLSLRGQLDLAREEVNRLDRKTGELAADRAESKSAADDVASERDALRNQRNTLEVEKAELSRKLDDMQTELDERPSADDVTVLRRELVSVQKMMAASLTESESKRLALQEENSRLKEIATRVAGSVSALSQADDAASPEVSEHEYWSADDCSALLTEIDEMEERQLTWSSQQKMVVKAAENRLDEVQKKLQETQAIVDKTSAEAATRDAHIESLLADVTRLEAERSRLSADLEQLGSQISSGDDETNTLLSQLRAQVSQLGGESGQLRSQLVETEDKLRVAQRQLADEVSALHRVSEQERAQSEEEKQSQSDVFSREKSELARRCEQMAGELEVERRRLEELEQLKTTSETELSRYRHELDTLTETVNTLEEEARVGGEESERNQGQLAGEMGQLKLECAKTQSEAARLREELSELEKSRSELETERLAVAEKLSAVERELAASRDNATAEAEQSTAATRQILERKTSLEAEVARERAAKETLELRLAEMAGDLERTESQHEDKLAALRGKLDTSEAQQRIVVASEASFRKRVEEQEATVEAVRRQLQITESRCEDLSVEGRQLATKLSEMKAAAAEETVSRAAEKSVLAEKLAAATVTADTAEKKLVAVVEDSSQASRALQLKLDMLKMESEQETAALTAANSCLLAGKLAAETAGGEATEQLEVARAEVEEARRVAEEATAAGRKENQALILQLGEAATTAANHAAALESERLKTDARLRVLQDAAVVQTRRLEEKESELAELSAQLNGRVASCLKLETQLQDLEQQRDVLARRCADLVEEQGCAQEEVDRLQFKLEDAQVALQELGREHQTMQVTSAKHASRKWARDDEVLACKKCTKSFSIALRKHHCRHCGDIYCADCSAKTAKLPAFNKPVRVCDRCYGEMQRL